MKIEAYQKVTPYSGSQLIQLVWKGVSSCNFDLRPNNTAGNGANSPLFVVLPSAKAVPTTVGLSSPTSTSTAMSTATGAGDSSGILDTPSNNGLNSGAKTGIGVGVAVVAVAVIAGLAFFFLRRRRSKNLPEFTTMARGNAEEYYGGGQKYQPVDSTMGSDVQMQEMNAETSTPKPGELDSDIAHELSSTEVRR
jgi:LPXTG-motif cell wall-anchored protein